VSDVTLELTPEQQVAIDLELELCGRIEAARYDFNEYLELQGRDDKGRAMRQAWLHRTWQGHLRWSWAHGLHPIVMSPWGHGKCLAEGSLVQSADGRLVPIEQWQGGELLALNERRMTFERVAAGPAFSNGVREVFEVRLRSGRVVRCTANHPLLTLLGWKWAGHLVRGQLVATMPSFSERSVAWDEVQAIESIGERPTYDLTVPGLHNFVCDGVVVHNSVQLAVEMVPWLLGRCRPLRILVITNVDDNSKLRVAAVERIITTRPELKAIFPGLRIAPGPHSKVSFSVEGGSQGVDPSIASFGIFGSGTSRRSDFMLFDDIVDENNAIKSPALRQPVIDHVDNKWLPRLEPPCMHCQCTGVVGGIVALEARVYEPCSVCAGTGGGRSVGIGTAWHTEDYWHNRIGTEGFCVLMQRVTDGMDSYSSEVYGVPANLKYPSLEELILYGSPAANTDQLLSALDRDRKRVLRAA
jgi:hypothetical protein